MHLGRNIRRVRELLNVKQQTQADLLSVSQQTVSKIEQTQYMSNSVIDRIAKALAVEAGVILYYDDARIINYLRAKDAVTHCYLTLQNQVEFLRKTIKLFDKLIEEGKKFG